MDSEIDQIIQNILNDNVPTISGGAGRSRKRKLPAALRTQNKKVMTLYREMKKKSPKVSGNILLKRAMKRSAKKHSKRR